MKRAQGAEATAAPRGARAWRILKMVLLLSVVAAIGIAGGVAWAVFHAFGGFKAVGDTIGSLKNPGARAFGERTRMNILCLGIDYNHDEKGMLYTKHARSDTIFVVSIDKSADNLSIVSIPRDMRVDIPGHHADKINTAYSYKAEGDVDLSRKTVEQFLGIKIDHTLVIKPYAVEHLVEALGGVSIDVEKNMDYDDNWGNLHIHLKKGFQHLDGKQAVGYIRFRKDAEGDRGRIRRQQQFVNAMLSQLPRLQTVTRIGQVQEAIKNDIHTSISYADLIDLGVLYKSFDRKKMKSGRVDGNDELIDDQYFMVADEAQKRKLVAQLLKGGVEEQRRPAEVRVEVLNASGVSGAAGRFADVLRGQGYQVVRVGNADLTANTQVLDRLDDVKVSGALQRLVPTRGAVAEVKPDKGKGNDADVTILLGENFRPQ